MPKKRKIKKDFLEEFLKKTTVEEIVELHKSKNKKKIRSLLVEAYNLLNTPRWTEYLLTSEEEKVKTIISQLKAIELSENTEPEDMASDNDEITNLTNLIKQQEAKIVEVPTSLLAEKELKKELIQIHSKYIRAKKQKFPSAKYEKEYYKIKRIVTNIIEEEDMKQVQLILNECEELINLEIELENKKPLIKEYKQQKIKTGTLKKKKRERKKKIYQEEIWKSY